MRISLYDYCKKNEREKLLEEFAADLNGSLTPETLSYGSRRKVWWRCEKGHIWQAAVFTRKDGARCPYCVGKRPLPGVTDLAALYPHIAAQWHPTRNEGKKPEDVRPSSHLMVWWMCEKGHEWQAIVKSRTAGNGCPVCAGREIQEKFNDLASQYPVLAKEWHPTKNGALRPTDVGIGTPRKVWWQCEQGHEWMASVSSRVWNTGCPYCSGKVVIPGETDLETIFPAIAAQWHPTKNGALKPSDVSPYSNRRVWWIDDLGHEWITTVASRTKRDSGCTYCTGRKVLAGFNDLATVDPKLAEQWHPTLNGALTPSMVTIGSHKMAWWECPNGHVWKAVVYSRASGRKYGCPVCAGRTKGRNIRITENF